MSRSGVNDESLAGSGGDTRPLPLTRPLLGLPTLPRAYQVNLQVSLPSLSIAFKCLGLASLPENALIQRLFMLMMLLMLNFLGGR